MTCMIKKYTMILPVLLCIVAGDAIAKDIKLYVNLGITSRPANIAKLVGQYIKENMDGIDRIIVIPSTSASGLAGPIAQYDNSNSDDLVFGIHNQIVHHSKISNLLDKKYLDSSEIYFTSGRLIALWVPIDKSNDIKTLQNSSAILHIGLPTNLNLANALERIGLDVLNIKYKAVGGYKNVDEARLATLRGETDIMQGQLNDPDFTERYVDTNLVKPLWRLDTSTHPSDRSLRELYKSVEGKNPENLGILWKSYITLSDLAQYLSTQMIQFRGFKNYDPAEAKKIHKIIEKMSTDPKILENPIGYSAFSSFKIGKEAEDLVKNFSVSPEVEQFLSRYND